MTEKVTLPPSEKMAEMVRWSVERSDDWDMMTEFVILEWDEEAQKLTPAVVSMFAAGICTVPHPIDINRCESR